MKNFKDLDRWIAKNPKIDKFGNVYLMSHYDALVENFGQARADSIMRNIEVASWSKDIGKMLKRSGR